MGTNNETKLDVSLEALREIERAAGVFLNSSLSTSKECIAPAARRFASMVYEIARTASAKSSTTALEKAKNDIKCNVVLRRIAQILLEQKPVANMTFTAMEMSEMIASRCRYESYTSPLFMGRLKKGQESMKIEEFLERLEGVQKSSGGWIAWCPAHGDSNPSLSVSESGNRILVHCHAGCKPDEIVAAVGLKMKDLFTDSNGRGDAPSPKVKKV